MQQGRKITALVLGWVEDSVVRSNSRGFGVAEASSKCGVASIVLLPLGPVLRNELPGAGSTRSADTVDGRWSQWLDCVPGAGPSGDTRSRRCFLWFWLRR